MDINTILQAIADVTGQKWLPLAVLIVGWLTTMLGDTSKFPINIPDRWKPVIVIVLGQVYAVLQAVTGGASAGKAIWNGLLTSFVTMGMFDVVIKAIFQGNLPKWLAWLALIDPNLAAAKSLGTLKAPLFGKASIQVKAA
jgi:hypothetical protein